MISVFAKHLARDHKRLLKMVRELQLTCKKSSINSKGCFEQFLKLKAFYKAQCKAEEYTLYAALEENHKFEDARLLGLVHEAYAEHDLADQVLKEMGQAEEVTIPWMAKLRVFESLLIHHMKKEETEILEQAIEFLGSARVRKLEEEYTQERESIFAKKSGRISSALLAFSALPSETP